MTTTKPPRCQGHIRHGGAFTLGPVTWHQCRHDAQVILNFVQDGEAERMPACLECWQRCIEDDGIQITAARPLTIEDHSDE